MPAASPNTGKTAAKYCRPLIGGANLCGDARQFRVGNDYDTVDVSGLCTDVKENVLGGGMVAFDFQAVFNNAAAAAGTDAGAYTQGGTWSTSATHGTLAIGVRTAPAVGNPAFSAALLRAQFKANAARDGAVVLDVVGEVAAGQTVATQAKNWGVLLAAGTDLSGTTTYDWIDNGASSANGAWAVLHLTAPSTALTSNNWSITIEDSADSSSWATIITFTADGLTLTSEAKKYGSTVRRYVRAVATKTAGNNIRPWINFVRL